LLLEKYKVHLFADGGSMLRWRSCFFKLVYNGFSLISLEERHQGWLPREESSKQVEHQSNNVPTNFHQIYYLGLYAFCSGHIEIVV
jgi:hypothetical protein